MGAFHGIGSIKDVVWDQIVSGQARRWLAGIRMCPNPACRSLIFFTWENASSPNGTRVVYPPEVIDFDASNLPNNILEALEEAVKAHGAGCYKASALMVRRLLEELCRDKNAEGKDLKARLAALSKSIVLPNELIVAADELRLLGNDAAHVESKDYDTIGKDEAALAIELAKELLKAVYQYTSLLCKLKALKKPNTP
jgi:hypothetical protein